jgi:HPt (histidine-containing phosphotransfer) domain-containing protein
MAVAAPPVPERPVSGVVPAAGGGALPGLTPAAAAAFAALRANFVAGLPARWAEITSAADDDSRCRAALHRLAGAAGGYGCAPLGEAARRAEQAPVEALPGALAELERCLRATLDTVR